MLDEDKVSLDIAAQYVGLSPEALGSMESAGWIKRISQAGSIPVYRGADVKRLKKAAPEETPAQKFQKRIQEQRVDIQKRIQRAKDELVALQDRCTHPNALKENKASTGNWSQSDDSYWKECFCLDCGKLWREDQ